VVFSLRDVPDELRPAATLLALDATWRQVSDPAQRRRRLITVDEAWLLMRDPEGAKFLYRLAKSARKAWAGLAAVTQDAEDVLSTDLGRAVIANSATQILLRQAPQAIGKVAGEFRLSAGERQLLLAARRGEGLLAAGPSARVSFQALASPAEHFLCTSSPEFLAKLEADKRNLGVNPSGDPGESWRSANPWQSGGSSLCRESRARHSWPRSSRSRSTVSNTESPGGSQRASAVTVVSPITVVPVMSRTGTGWAGSRPSARR
jgi:hypothetical protein